MTAPPVTRPTPRATYVDTTATTVIPTNHQTAKTSRPDADPSVSTIPGIAIPAITFRLLLFRVSLTTAAPRPCSARRTAVSTFGRLVREARTSVPVTTSETPHRWPR